MAARAGRGLGSGGRVASMATVERALRHVGSGMVNPGDGRVARRFGSGRRATGRSQHRYNSFTHRQPRPRKDGNVAKTTVPPAPTLLNRELSWLDFNERVLALAADDIDAAARARQVLLDLRRRTWTSSSWCASPACMDQAASGLRGALARRADAARDARRDPRARGAADERALAPLAEGASGRRSPQEGILVGRVDDCRSDELAELDRHVSSARSSRC